MAEPIKIKLEFARGDSFEKGFILKNKATGEPITEPYDEIYFTVKKYYTDSDYLFQKRMSTGSITSDGDGHYTLYIEPEDTNGLAFGEYDCDIEVKNGTYKKTFYGKLNLTKEVTHQGNE